MILKLSTSISLILLFFTSFSQTDPNNVPKPPTEKLSFFNDYIGVYDHTMDFAGMKWSGTLEIKPAVKGWYIDIIILTKTLDGKIDRENFQRLTWDQRDNQYKIWRFTTAGPSTEEFFVAIEGKDFIIAGQFYTNDGTPILYYNRYSMPTKDSLLVTTEHRDINGKVMKYVGTTWAKKRK